MNKPAKLPIFLLLIGTSIFSIFPFCNKSDERLVGVYWGAFDPPTSAHLAIITTALEQIPLRQLFVVVNNHSYKNYTYPLDARLQLIKDQIPSKNVVLLWQDDEHRLDFTALRALTKDRLCAIAGHDAYYSWLEKSTEEERAQYDCIAVIPRGDVVPELCDLHAFLLPIDPEYKHVSSSQIKEDVSKYKE